MTSDSPQDDGSRRPPREGPESPGPAAPAQEKPATWATAADVARRAGVSRTFTKGASVSPDTRAKVLRAAEALGYQGEHAGQRPDGVFCANDALACGLIDGARQFHALRVPEDLRVVGFDDIPMSAYTAYALTTFRQDVAALADQAVACLAERMGNPDLPGRVPQLPVNLVERRSSQGPAGATPPAGR